ncbi:unnamed protein product, partial [Ixodes pacificus]
CGVLRRRTLPTMRDLGRRARLPKSRTVWALEKATRARPRAPRNASKYAGPSEARSGSRRAPSEPSAGVCTHRSEACRRPQRSKAGQADRRGHYPDEDQRWGPTGTDPSAWRGQALVAAGLQGIRQG